MASNKESNYYLKSFNRNKDIVKLVPNYTSRTATVAERRRRFTKAEFILEKIEPRLRAMLKLDDSNNFSEKECTGMNPNMKIHLVVRLKSREASLPVVQGSTFISRTGRICCYKGTIKSIAELSQKDEVFSINVDE